MEQDYLIAGHRIRIEGENLMQAMNALDGFSVFKVESADEPVCRFMTADTPVPEFEKVHYRSEIDCIVSRFGRYIGGYRFEMAPANAPALHLWMPDGAHIANFSGNLTPRLLRFACWIAYGVATAPLQTVAIHTSTIQYRDCAVFFLGESGTGKSTHTRLWRENIEGAVLLNDDSPILRIIDGKPWVFGSPWSGKTPCYRTDSYPLAACVRLSQAPYNEIKRLKVIQAYGALHPSCPPCFAYDEALYDAISGVLSAVLSAVPVYHLACLPDAEAARLSCETIFGA